MESHVPCEVQTSGKSSPAFKQKKIMPIYSICSPFDLNSINQRSMMMDRVKKLTNTATRPLENNHLNRIT